MTNSEYSQIRRLRQSVVEHMQSCNCWRARLARLIEPVMTWQSNLLMRIAGRAPLE